ncbi:MAG: hypothetical protein KGH69_04570 [Candidatus Micrarchaeota archaeon]|nr:hypothetical protein [Candidatus Micrarchaeota archaeon]
MPFSLPNIYKSRHSAYFMLIPLAMMLLGIYLSKGIVLDSSLSGGVSIILQTNSTMTAQQAASKISSLLNVVSPSVVVSSSTVSITLPKNVSLADAESSQLAFYSAQGNYTSALVNLTNVQVALQNQPGNSTLALQERSYSSTVNRSLAAMQASVSAELAALRPLIGDASAFNYSDPLALEGVSSSAYQNASSVYKDRTMSELHSIFSFSSYSYEQITVLQSQYFLGKLKTIIIAAFILIAILVFIIFRSPIPSFAVIFGAVNDMVIALGAMALFKIPLGIASIGGLLMLLGYSIDTDVLTAIRILKRSEGAPEDRAYGSMMTGLTMTLTAIVSFAVLFVISVVEYVPTYYEISGVVLCGLVGDLFTTWLINANLILMYSKDKHFISNWIRKVLRLGDR